ncbi:substrate-binding domain-containing protein [Pseudoduganella sp. DS3]|uniref:Substrate-binding domain-containing protein n=1 Tax=Pseudoduganella guangdongensis TaxID=2692179 RepID=A0A6N9HCY9_9BURK|nr:LacI family DNA-binding transcriptional regulator [Pseudoduganella guangdongensis]MYN01408.1 substrate-binding domain-containing protein [Pseudoduganella guangdongensis]
MSQVTLRGIAEATGLSIGTVSRALKNQVGMTEETRNKVREAAMRLGYDFGQLKKGRIRRIAFLLHNQHNTLASSPFFSPVLQGAEAACRREGVALSFIAVGPAEPVLAQIRLHQPDAIVCAGFFEPEVLATLQQVGKPIVLVDMHWRGFTSVNPDNMRGGYLATQHLLRCGRKRIAMLSGSLAHYSIQQRNRGFRQALFDAKVHADPNLEVIVPTMGEGDEGVVEAMRSILSLPKPADAVFCYNDSTALAAMKYCLGEGMKIPHDIAIVGFDDIAAAAAAIPPLSTIHVDKEELGKAGIELLLNKQDEGPSQITVPVQMIVRESSFDD